MSNEISKILSQNYRGSYHHHNYKFPHPHSRNTDNNLIDVIELIFMCVPIEFPPYRIREVADKINKYGAQSPQALQSLKTPVKQIVIGPSHLGLLLEDGRALRVAFTVIAERLDLSKAEPNKGYVGMFVPFNEM